MDTLIAIYILAGIAFVLTRVVCRRSVSQIRPPSFLLAIAGAFCTALVMVVILYGRDLFTQRFWNNDNMLVLVPMAFGVCMLLSLIPASLVVWHYRKKFRDKNPVA
jgi:hypothetical protein